MVFQQSSGWIRAYRWCGSLLARVGIKAGTREPKDLCTLLRVYGLTALLLGGLLSATYGLVTSSVDGYQTYQSFYRDDYGLIALVNIPAVGLLFVAALICGAVAGVAGLFHLAYAWHEHRFWALRWFSTSLRWSGIILGGAFMAVMMVVYFTLVWPLMKIGQALRSRTSEKASSPTLLQVLGSWLSGLLHGFCARIVVTG